jgi:hypothetical protein
MRTVQSKLDMFLKEPSITSSLKMNQCLCLRSLWRRCENLMHDRSHAVIRLAVHLPLEQHIFFRGQELEAVDRASRGNTTLLAWFELNQSNESTRTLLHICRAKFQNIMSYTYIYNLFIIKYNAGP